MVYTPNFIDIRGYIASVSYTHLDVYKRQVCVCVLLQQYIKEYKGAEQQIEPVEQFTHWMKPHSINIYSLITCAIIKIHFYLPFKFRPFQLIADKLLTRLRKKMFEFFVMLAEIFFINNRPTTTSIYIETRLLCSIKPKA